MVDIHHSIFLKTIRKEPVPRTPLWIMRQAGRYLPEYRETRAQAGDFLTLCKTPELACEVTLQPLKRFELDAAILFSDILTIPDAMGLGLYFSEGEGPCFERPVRCEKAVSKIATTVVENDLAYVMQAAALIRKEMPTHLPLIGFSGSPWTLACYMVEGKSTRDFKHILQMIYTQPTVMHALLDKLAVAVQLYLIEQIKAGVNVVMLFDTWGGVLSRENYQAFSLSYLSTIITGIKKSFPDIPVILFTKGGGQWLVEQATTKADVIGLDWTCDMGKARKQIGHKVALQGNLDPAVMRTTPQCIRTEVKKVLESYGHGSGHIFNLGHGITPDVPPEHVEILSATLKELSPHFHKA